METLNVETLNEVASLVNQCTLCELSKGRSNAVPGEGSAESEVMFIGEGPGFHEDRLGRPFVGPAGQFLDELLASIGLRREQVFIANMIKCRPPQNRDPLPGEMQACARYLDRQIELINPKLIVTLGRFSLGRFFPGESITRARGKLRKKDGRSIYPVMHPAAALHRQENRSTIVNDFKAIPELLAKLARPLTIDAAQDLAGNPPTAAAPPRKETPETPEPQQLSLFGP